MIARARSQESVYRHGAGGREPLATPGQGGTHVHYQSSHKVGIGAITSRPRPAFTFFQLLAFELAGGGDPNRAAVPFCTTEQARRLYEQGLVK